jgi:hypothetical protein
MSQWQIRERSRGLLYIAEGDDATTDVTTGGTYVKVAGTTTAGLLANFTHTNGRLTYNGPKRIFDILAVITCTVNLSGGIVHVKIAKNGTIIDATEQHRKIAAANDKGNMSCSGSVELVKNDYIEMFTTTDLGQDNKLITFEHLSVSIW